MYLHGYAHEHDIIIVKLNIMIQTPPHNRQQQLRTQWGNRLGGLLDLHERFSSAAKRGESGYDFQRDELPAADFFSLIHAPGSDLTTPHDWRTRSIAGVRWSTGHAMRSGSAPSPFLRVTVWDGWGLPKTAPDCDWVVRDSPGLRVVDGMFCAGCAAVLSAKIPPEVVQLVLLPYLQDPRETYRGLFFASHFYAGIQAEASREFLGRARSFIQEALAAYAAQRGLFCCLRFLCLSHLLGSIVARIFREQETKPTTVAGVRSALVSFLSTVKESPAVGILDLPPASSHELRVDTASDSSADFDSTRYDFDDYAACGVGLADVVRELRRSFAADGLPLERLGADHYSPADLGDILDLAAESVDVEAVERFRVSW
eukprot:g6327.t1